MDLTKLITEDTVKTESIIGFHRLTNRKCLITLTKIDESLENIQYQNRLKGKKKV